MKLKSYFRLLKRNYWTVIEKSNKTTLKLKVTLKNMEGKQLKQEFTIIAMFLQKFIL